jgi:ribonuclease J
MVVVILAMDKQTGRVAGRPEVVSRGFVDMDESDDLIDRTRDRVLSTLEGADHIVEWGAVHTQVKEAVAKFLYDETRRRPMVLPVAVEV